MAHRPTRSKHTTLQQVCNLIPPYLVSKLARKHGVDKKARTFTPWSHVVSLLYAQLVHAIGLNDVCDGLANHASKLFCIRNATPPKRNTLSHANKVRDAKMAEELFWSVLHHLTHINTRFGGRSFGGFPRRFKRVINVVDATTIQLVANCIDWASHRRKKAAAKMHLGLNLQSFLPRFAIIDTARQSDSKRARELCAGMGGGEIVLFDKAYVDFKHLYELAERGVFWITRAKDNMQIRCRKRLLRKPAGNILRDDLIVLKCEKSRRNYPAVFRRVVAIVEVDGKDTVMTFITNNLEWSPGSIADLYRCRWSIEVFFKQIKQTLQLCDFLGHNRNAILWQVWMALLLYALLRFLGFSNNWRHSFKRLFCVVRSVVWDGLALVPLLSFYGTAGGVPRMRATPEQAYFPGLEPLSAT
jgi:DDE family transposase/uncharacterized protein DUF4372